MNLCSRDYRQISSFLAATTNSHLLSNNRRQNMVKSKANRRSGREAGNPYNLRSHGNPAPAALAADKEENKRRYLTDNPNDPDTTGENITDQCDGAANPRAENKVHDDMLISARNQVAADRANGRVFEDADAAAEELAADLAKETREEGETWGLAMRILARDIATADEPNKGLKGQTLCETRETLPNEFFSEMVTAYCDVARRADLSAEDLNPASPQP
ncbi:hypothetical protein QBC34DRAFT_428759 [Podospora aff. communis PSN243]|uniref:Uncharacterized protein n=1 Tax=Podospora aff. communis PSN243 TaxID=3040156 RepID=A0AAV9GEE8_9PEZI|nr:hypothetical protein QBC34DRAFT_428759 [Podospora aff. communis PSN243]